MATSAEAPVRLCCYLETEVIGGMEVSVATLLANLDPQYDVTVLGVSEPVVAFVADERPGIATRVLSPVRHKSNIRAIASHVRAMHELKPDLLLVSLSQLYDAQYALLAAVLNRVPTYAVVHCVLPSASRSQNLIFRALSRGVRAFGGVSRSVCADTEARLGLPSGSVALLYNGVAVTGWSGAVPPAHDGPPGRLVVGAVGRLVPEKGFDVLIHAMVELADAELVLMGDGPARAELEDLARRLGVRDRITFTGWVEPPWAVRQRCDVLAVPSRVEGFGLVAVEGLLAGIPVVASRVGGLPEVIEDGVTGLLVEPGDSGSLARALGVLAADAVLRSDLAERGRAEAGRRFSVPAMAAAYAGFLAD